MPFPPPPTTLAIIIFEIIKQSAHHICPERVVGLNAHPLPFPPHTGSPSIIERDYYASTFNGREI